MVKLYACLAFLSLVSFTAPQAERNGVATPKPAISSVVERGWAIAFDNCQTCHAVGRTGPSANLRAPPLRTLSQKYPISTLSEAFAEGVLVGHTEMPEFEFEPDQVDALLAYIESIQTHNRSGKAKKRKAKKRQP